MRLSGRLSTIAVSVATIGSLCLFGAVPAEALSVPAPLGSVGSATLVPDGSGNFVLALNGSIAVGSGTFLGRASGIIPTVVDGFPTNQIPSFSLQGAGL